MKGNFTLQAYSDVEWAGCVDGRKSTSGGSFFLGDRLVSWHNKKQEFISLSTTEAKYIAAATCCSQVLWMKQKLKDCQVEFSDRIPIMCDNSSTINISKNPVMHYKMKHIVIKYHFLRIKVVEKEAKVEYVCIGEQMADIFTMPCLKTTLSI